MFAQRLNKFREPHNVIRRPHKCTREIEVACARRKEREGEEKGIDLPRDICPHKR